MRRFYKGDNGIVLQSVPATEHSVMTAGTPERGDETDMFRSIISLYPSGIVSVVSDTYDLWAVLTKVLPELHDEIVTRDGKLVIRPDSGDPADILCGTAIQKNLPADKGVVELLWDEFGGTVNEQGYKVLDPHIGAIYGDSITVERAKDIVERLAAKGFASTNVVFGVGSFTYQYVTRDTFGSAIKATWVLRSGEGHPMRKDPVTDNGSKRSARGRLAVLVGDRGELTLHENVDAATEAQSLLQPVWADGEFIEYQSFRNVRDRLAEQAASLAARTETVAA
ncbi:hypothetical protein GCM10025867_48420 (plasmid) [Frondihabitans sucicola]|uniref:Nicotinamide phosphoribosyltransferase n=1 Tax=Frondihabitans sucicola TaxID=1268041 RepID=A0ABN6Y614_9MICO|nr:hypothetical protein GCM10025867_48420 [Frondihabitans sucicola]